MGAQLEQLQVLDYRHDIDEALVKTMRKDKQPL